MKNNLTVLTGKITKNLVSDEWPLVRVNIRYPQCGNKKADKYISDIARSLYKFAQKKLLPQALKENAGDEKAEPYSLVAIYKTTMDNERFFSFYFDVFVSKGKRRSEVRRIPLNFDIERSAFVLPLDKMRKKTLLPLAIESAEALSRTEPLFSDYQKRLCKYFKKSNAIITSQGIFVTYDSGLLAPDERGAFSLPVLKNGQIN